MAEDVNSILQTKRKKLLNEKGEILKRSQPGGLSEQF
jgi:hypothetical protein